MCFPIKSAVMKEFHESVGVSVAAFGIVMMLAAPALAADESAWADDTRSAVRLIAGANKDGAANLRGGIEIKLQPGWKTYWRYPGDSGIPPRFDFSGSDNLGRAKVLYPAPHLFTDETGNSLGYKDRVIFPLQISRKDPSKPVKLRLKIDYAACEKLCIPAEGRAELTIGTGNSAHEASLTTFETQVPKPATAAELDLTARRINDARKPLVAVDLKTSGKKVDVFVEGPSPEWALPIPQPAQGAPAGRRHFGFELDGLPPGVDPKEIGRAHV